MKSYRVFSRRFSARCNEGVEHWVPAREALELERQRDRFRKALEDVFLSETSVQDCPAVEIARAALKESDDG